MRRLVIYLGPGGCLELRGDKRFHNSIITVAEDELGASVMLLAPEYLRQIRDWCDKRLEEIEAKDGTAKD